MTTTMQETNSSIHFAGKVNGKFGTDAENGFYSPFSLLLALGMCATGAREETLESLAGVLGCPTSLAEQRVFFKQLMDELRSENAAYELKTANALWHQNGVSINPDWSGVIREDFKATISGVDFEKNTAGAIETINNWCSTNTNGKIPKIVNNDTVTDETVLVLTNAIYFKGKWKKQFNKKNTTKSVFHGANGDTMPWVMHTRINQDLPAQKGETGLMECLYGETETFQAVNLDYEGDELSMLVVLPRADMAGLNADIEATYLSAIDSLTWEDKVYVSLPKFKFETEYDASGALMEAGGGVAFSNAANFSGITSDTALKISCVVHKAFVEVDEEGTEAAAATAVVMMRCASVRIPAPPKEFNVDRPFLFFIRNKKTNAIFCGRVSNLPNA